MVDKIKQQLKLSWSSSVDEGDEEFLYETIEAPKFVDFTRPNHFCPDDRYWFCSRVGCDRKHEEEIDSEAIYKDFVLRVMAARSPNVRLRKALTRKPPSESKKCPLSAPPKPSKSRLPRLALATSISKKLLNDAKRTTKPSTTPKTRVKHVAAKYMTSPRKKSKPRSPNPNAFRSVRNTRRPSITIPKNKVVAKALVFNSPQKTMKTKKAHEQMATPITKLCEGIKKLEIASQKKGNAPKPPKECRSVKKLLPSDAPRIKPSAQKAKTRKEAISSTSVKNKMKQKNEKKGETMVHEARSGDDSSDMEIDEKSRVGSLDLKKTSEVKLDAISVNTLTSEAVSSEDGVLVHENIVFEAQKVDDESTKKKGDIPEGEVDNQNTRELVEQTDNNDEKEKNGDAHEGEVDKQGTRVLGELTDNNDEKEKNRDAREGEVDKQNTRVLGELTDNDDKENALNSDDIRNLNSGNRVKNEAPMKHKTPKTTNKSIRENCSAENGTHGVKYKKLKPTNPKPFRLRTDERGILKDTTLERKPNSHENSTTTSENSQNISNGISVNREKAAKKMIKRVPIKSKYKVSPKKVEIKSDRGLSSEKNYCRITSSSLQKQLARPQRETVSHIRKTGLGVIEETSATILKPKKSDQRYTVNPTKKVSTLKRQATVSKEPNFQCLHKPKGCTKNVEQQCPLAVKD